MKPPRTDTCRPASGGVAALRRLAGPGAPPIRAAGCKLCSSPLETSHEHLLELSTHRLYCACQPCAILFSNDGPTRFRRVPKRVLALHDFELSNAQWDFLGIPIQLAFFLYSQSEGRLIVFYPSPAGATSSTLPCRSWQELAEGAELPEIQPDVEALLVNRVTSEHAYFIVPVDECYRLVGLLRTHWSGFSGGDEVWRQIDGFFAGLGERSTPSGGVT